LVAGGDRRLESGFDRGGRGRGPRGVVSWRRKIEVDRIVGGDVGGCPLGNVVFEMVVVVVDVVGAFVFPRHLWVVGIVVDIVLRGVVVIRQTMNFLLVNVCAR
jgi:hypothetical protein